MSFSFDTAAVLFGYKHTSKCLHKMLNSFQILFTFVVLFGTSFLVRSQSPQYEEKYITLPVDHFNYVDDKSFQLRYLINDTFSHGNPDAPILFYCGNEASIEYFAKVSGLIWELAPKLNALVVFAEHRYFGKSLPFKNDSMKDREHYGYLTTEQALADFAALVNLLNKDSSKRRPTIAIGGSHGGVLAAFFRMKYPHIVAGALASSAPMRKFSNLTRCDVYTKIITNVFEHAYNKNCSLNIKKTWTAFKEIAEEPEGVSFFNDVFNFCDPWEDSDQIDNFLNAMDGIYWHMAMTNYPYEADVYAPLPANPVRAFCFYLGTELNGRDLVKAFRSALNVYTNHDGKKKCFKFSHRNIMEPHEVEAFNFQRCSEIIIAFCSKGENNMFRSEEETFEDAVDLCKQDYHIGLDQDLNRIKNHFGLENLKSVSNIIFSNGLLDPWSGAGILTAPNDKIIVINIPEGAHHIDLRYSNEKDPPSVVAARYLEMITFKKWIREFRRKNYN